MRLDRLQYQRDAIEKIMAEINSENITAVENFYANPILQHTQNIDVKMETGTGKTYVYTRLMHELKQQYGFFKFILFVPSIAIKEGVKMSIQSDDWNKHFRQEFGNQQIHLGVINAGDFETKKNRKQIPETLRSFCDASRAEDKNIQTLLLNRYWIEQKSSALFKSDYDSTLFGSISCPADGIRNTRPIVIIDEPHRFAKDDNAYRNIIEKLQPQLVVRFGATFPSIAVGKGKNKTTKIDYERGKPIYDLNSVRAFNDGLVKGVSIQYPAIPNTSDDADILKCKVKSINKEGYKFKSVTFSINNHEMEVPIGSNLSIADENFGDLVLDIENKKPTLSNGTELSEGMILLPQIFGTNYQEILLKQALEEHFEKEKDNFFRQNKIKTNSLFFIDDIASFRGENAWLRIKFEELLAAKINAIIESLDSQLPKYNEYIDFLRASLAKNDKGEMLALAGYFAQDSSGGEEIQKEIDLVLRDKEQSLKFKNDKGEWNVCRFFFSKWTLCEGWDNPNVFVITKLRSSGSEIRKLQEVGRGLRLPFDENGIRISEEEFYLSYITDYSEREFAKKLVGEINADGGNLSDEKITDNILELLVKSKYATSTAEAKGKLLLDKIIDEHDKILDTEKLFALLSDESGLKLKSGKILDPYLPKKPMVKLNKDNFNKLKDLWQQITERYLLHFEKLNETEFNKLLKSIFDSDVFAEPSTQVVEQHTLKGEHSVGLYHSGFRSVKSPLSEISYGEFLKRLHKSTNIPLSLLHKNIFATLRNRVNTKELFNLVSLENITKAFRKKFEEFFAQKYDYSPLDYKAQTSLFTAEDEFVDELAQGMLGNKKGRIEKDDRYLYEMHENDPWVVYDSEIEYNVLKVKPPQEVVAYGKLPKKSIKVPTYTGGTTSPDFVYAIREKSTNKIRLHLIVETKSSDLRMSETSAIEAQKKLFKKIKNVEWRMETDVAVFERELKALVG